ncbi:uncharacterized protein LOC141856960 [Brevipalpus obovatus]|uniref:uncharacterized protein LOC141856960 n=1 Tax=Brevipalpus obovatus TaxID=246614 RepID=UPI003D9E47F9
MKLVISNLLFVICVLIRIAEQVSASGYEVSNVKKIPPKPSVSGTLDPQTRIDRLLRVVSQNRAKSCLLRVICELGVDPECMGEDGQNFINSIREMGMIEDQKLEAFREAHILGETFEDGEVCVNNFQCNFKSPQFVRMANLILKR